MEAGDYTTTETKGAFQQGRMKTTTWHNDWESFKQKFEATADLNGLNGVVIAGQLLAEDKISWPWSPAKVEMSDEIAEEETFQRSSESMSKTMSNEKLMGRATVQSHRLASMLILSLIDSTGIQKSIVGDRLRYEKDGVRAWADLVMHFEMSSKDLRVENLTRKWDDAVLGVGEHPDKLWTELTSINQNLKKLGEEFKDSHFTRRFVAGIKAQPSHPYKQVLTLYKGSIIAGAPLKINHLRELLSETYEDEKMAASRKSTILGAAMRCTFCTKEGHEEKECWTKNPALKQAHRDKNTSNKTMKNYRKPFRCYNCGKVGHRKRECTTLKETSNIAMAAKYNGTGATESIQRW